MKWTAGAAIMGLGIVALEPWIAWLGWFIAALSIMTTAIMWYSTRRITVTNLVKARKDAEETIAKMAPIVASFGVVSEENKELKADIKRLVEVNKAQDRTINAQAEMLERMERAQGELIRKMEVMEKRIEAMRDTMVFVANRYPEIPSSVLKWD